MRSASSFDPGGIRMTKRNCPEEWVSLDREVWAIPRPAVTLRWWEAEAVLEANKAVVRRKIDEVVNQGRLDAGSSPACGSTSRTVAEEGRHRLAASAVR